MSKLKLDQLQYFEKIKGADEFMVWTGKPLFFPFLLYSLIYGVIGLLFIGLAVWFNLYYVEIKDSSLNFIYIVLAIVFVPGLFSFLKFTFSYPNISYGISNKHIMLVSGLLETEIKIINYSEIKYFDLKINFIDKTFKTGTIKIILGQENDKDGGLKDKYVEIICIENPYQVYKIMKKEMSVLN